MKQKTEEPAAKKSSEWRRLCRLRADKVQLEISEKRKLLVTQESVDIRDAQQNEILLNDITSLPAKIAFKLANKPAHEIETMLKDELVLMLQHLKDSDIVNLEHPST